MLNKEDIERIEYHATVAAEFIGRKSPYAELGIMTLQLIDELYLTNKQIETCKKCKKRTVKSLPKRKEEANGI